MLKLNVIWHFVEGGVRGIPPLKVYWHFVAGAKGERCCHMKSTGTSWRVG